MGGAQARKELASLKKEERTQQANKENLGITAKKKPVVPFKDVPVDAASGGTKEDSFGKTVSPKKRPK